MRLFMIIGLISALTRGLWAIEPSAADGFLPLVNTIVKGQELPKELNGEETKLSLYAVAADHGLVARHGSYDDVPQGSVAIISIRGPIMKYDGWCSYGTMSLAQQVREADAHPNVIGTLLEWDSPGGMVSYAQTFSDIVKNTKKPVVSFINDGMMASAAYWIASGSDEIIASQTIDNIGSIGVYTTLADWHKYYESQGLRVIDVYADQSTEKNLDVKEALDNDNPTPLKLEFLNPVADKFISTVTTNRAGRLDSKKGNPFKGKLYMSPEALEIGLIDRIGSMESAIQRVHDLSTVTTESSQGSESQFKVTI